jgi:hypothetical protein
MLFAAVHESAFGTKRISLVAPHMIRASGSGCWPRLLWRRRCYGRGPIGAVRPRPADRQRGLNADTVRTLTTMSPFSRALRAGDVDEVA